MPGWRVWGELRRRPHIELIHVPMADNAGLIEDLGGGRRRISLDTEIDQCERRAVLAHELVHDDRDALFDDDTPIALVAKLEAYVDAETTRRLVPIDELELLVRSRVLDGGTVGWRDVHEWFDVPKDIAVEALEQLQERARRRHASLRPSSAPSCSGQRPLVRRAGRPSPPAEQGPHVLD